MYDRLAYCTVNQDVKASVQICNVLYSEHNEKQTKKSCETTSNKCSEPNNMNSDDRSHQTVKKN